jgi:hypothetical protein
MYFHTAAYVESLTTPTNADTDAVSDDVIQRRNNHLIFSEPFNLIASASFGVNITRQRFGNIALSFRGQNHLYPLNNAATFPSPPRVFDRRDDPLRMPLNEELTIETTGTDVGAQSMGAVLFFSKPNWSMQLPRGLERLTTRATATTTGGTATSWGNLTTLTFERELYNGVYAVVGAHAQIAAGIAFRLFFPSQPLAEGRQLRPGGLITAAITDFPWPAQHYGLGEWGRFQTFEPPSIQVLGAAGATEVRLDLIYLGSDERLLMAG